MIRKVIPEGSVYPKGYGVAWDDYRWGGPAEVVCYPIPLNLVLGVLRKAFLWCRYGMQWRYSRVRYLESRLKRLEIELAVEKSFNEKAARLHQEHIARIIGLANDEIRRLRPGDGEEWKGTT